MKAGSDDVLVVRTPNGTQSLRLSNHPIISFTSEHIEISSSELSTKLSQQYGSVQGLSFEAVHVAEQSGSTAESSTAIPEIVAVSYPEPNYGLSPVYVPFKQSVDISTATITLTPTEYTYTGQAITPTYSVSVGTTTLHEGTDYIVSCTNNINVGANTASITFTGRGDYYGSVTKYFSIVRQQTVTVIVNGQQLQPTAVSDDISDYRSEFGRIALLGGDALAGENVIVYVIPEANYVGQINQPEVTTTATGRYEFTMPATGTVVLDVTFTASKSLEGAKLTLSSDSLHYTGMPQSPTCSVELDGQLLTSGTDYRVESSNNTEAGIANLSVVGMGLYTGSRIDTTFVIYKSASYTVIVNNETITPYDLSLPTAAYNSSYGTVTIQNHSAAPGQVVTITVTPQASYEVYRLETNIKDYVITNDDKSRILRFLQPKSGDFTFSVNFLDPSTVDITDVGEGELSYELFDLRGVLISSDRHATRTALEELLRQLPSGLYILKTNNQSIKIEKR